MHLELLQKMADNTISESEREQLYAWLKDLSPDEYARAFDDYENLVNENDLPPFEPAWFERIEQRIRQEEEELRLLHRKTRVRTLYTRLAAAAILTLVAISWWLFHSNVTTTQELPPQQTALIAPGGNGAILTLSNGKQIILDSLGNGQVASENGAIISLQNDILNYSTTDSLNNAVGFNTITTPKGRQFHLALSDGSLIWLNAASTLKYPTVFKGPERKIQLWGEAYLEVAHSKEKPFLVETNGQTTIRVMGTSFNVQSYAEDTAQTITLLEGKVMINGHAFNTNKTVMLQPGHQAIQTTNTLLVQKADIEQALAWKNGLFNFENAGVKEAMQQIERWYNVEVVYPKGIPNVHFMGYMKRDLPLQEVLKGLQDADLHVTIEEGRKLVVVP